MRNPLLLQAGNVLTRIVIQGNFIGKERCSFTGCDNEIPSNAILGGSGMGQHDFDVWPQKEVYQNNFRNAVLLC
jgi:hypothetical protein